MKSIFDRKEKCLLFQAGDILLRWDTRQYDTWKNGKFDPLWYGPFRISEARSNNTFMLEDLHGEPIQLPVNGKYLKHYFQH